MERDIKLDHSLSIGARGLSSVSIVKVNNGDVKGAVERAIRLIGGFKGLIKKDKTVLIKPNLVYAYNSGTGIVTDARVTEAVTKLVLRQNPRKVIIGEGCGVGYLFPSSPDTSETFKISGTTALAERLGVDLIDLNLDKEVEVEVPDALVMKKFKVAKTVLDADVRISIPVLKTHAQAMITCSLKNMKGALPGVEKRLPHKLGLERAIVDLNKVVKPHFAVVDAMRGMQAMWKYPEDMVEMNLVLAGSDPVSVDSVCAQLMGFNPSTILHLKLAQDEKLGFLIPTKIIGERIANVSRSFVSFAKAFRSRYPSIELIEKNTCTGCIGEITNMLGFLDNSGLTSKIGLLKIIVGTPDEIPAKGEKLIIGKCALKFKNLGVYVPGCPPHGREIARQVCKIFNLDEEKLLETIRGM